MLILNCEEPNFLSMILLLNKFLDLVRVLVPIALIIVITIDIGKQVVSNDVEMPKLRKSIMNKMIAAIIVFLVPTLSYAILGFVKPSFPRLSICLNNANLQTINYLKEQRMREYERVRREKQLAAEKAKALAEAELKRLRSQVSIDELLKRKEGVLNEGQCSVIKGRTTIVEWNKNIRSKNPTTILVNYDKCEFITIKDAGGSLHWDFAPADLASSKRYYSWYNNQWSWNPRKGGLVYVNGVWSAAAFHGCPHAYGISGNGLSTLSANASCSVGAGYAVVNGGHFCLHFRGSLVHSEGGRYPASPNKSAQNEITRIVNDSKKYK